MWGVIIVHEYYQRLSIAYANRPRIAAVHGRYRKFIDVDRALEAIGSEKRALVLRLSKHQDVAGLYRYVLRSIHFAGSAAAEYQ